MKLIYVPSKQCSMCTSTPANIHETKQNQWHLLQRFTFTLLFWYSNVYDVLFKYYIFYGTIFRSNLGENWAEKQLIFWSRRWIFAGNSVESTSDSREAHVAFPGISTDNRAKTRGNRVNELKFNFHSDLEV